MRLKTFLTLCAWFALQSLCSATSESLIQDLRWRLVGPMRAGWSTCAEGIPGEAGVFYFGAVDGGVWKTTDNGVTWKPISDQAPFSSIGTLAIAHTKPATIYVGTGNVDPRYDWMDGNGVYKSSDDGQTWISLGLNDTQHIGRILIDPRNPDVLLVAALGHLFGSSAERGVYRSTDGGKNWQKVLFVNNTTGAVELASDPAVPDIVYAAMWQGRQYPWQSYFMPQIGPDSGIWKSIDGGKTWKQTSRKGLPQESLGRIGLAVATHTNGQRIYASITRGEHGGFYRSDNGGESWQLMNNDDELASSYFSRLTVDPQNTDTVYVMGRSVHVSHDGGKTFTISHGSPGGDDYHFLWIDPQNTARQVLTADQGTTVSINAGATWTPWYNQATGQFYHLATDNRFPYWIYSGQQDSGTVAIASRSNYGQLSFRDWYPVGGDERDYDLPDPDDPNIVFGSGLGGRLSRWDARTGRVSNVSPWPRVAYGKRPTTVKYRYTWITPIAISPHAPHALYQGSYVLFRSLDKGQSWSVVSPDLSGTDPHAQNCAGDVPIEHATACGYGVIFSIGISPAKDGLIWIGTDNGLIHLTHDNGKTWKNVTPKEIQDWSKITTIDASSKDPATAYAAVDRHRMDDKHPYIYRTHDFGKSWTSINSGIPADSWVNTVRQDPVQPNLLFAGTRTGAFFSIDDGDHWQSLQQNLPTTGVNDLTIHGSDLIAATQGRSIWAIDNIAPLRVMKSRITEATLAPPPGVFRLSANENRDTPLPPEMATTANPPAGAIIDYFLSENSTGPVMIEILDSKGTIVRRFRSDESSKPPSATRYFAEQWLQPPALPGTKAGHNRFVWNLRYERPKSSDYDFSIAAVPGKDTPIVPQGMLVLPGRYTIKLTAGTQSASQTLNVQKDPRSHQTLADLNSEYELYRQVSATLAKASDRLEALKEKQKKIGTPGGTEAEKESKALDQQLNADLEDSLAGVENALNSLVIDLEESDGPPTRQQRELYEMLETELLSLTR